MSLLLATMLVASGSAQRAEPIRTTIAEIRADPEGYHGRQVIVRGWMDYCRPVSCSIRRDPNRVRGGSSDGLSVGSSSEFDMIVADWLPSEIEMSATVDATCLRRDVVCLDRSPDLRGAKLLGVLRPAPVAGKRDKER